MRRACGRDDVLFDHRAAEVVAAVLERQLAVFRPHRYPRGLQVVDVIEEDSADRNHFQIFLRLGFLYAHIRIVRLKRP
ncbi:hypothetical protein D3C84_1062090 [compost metagenome]